MSKLSERLKELREEKGMSQKEFVTSLDEATNISVTPQSYGRYEKATRIPDVEFLWAVCKYYNVSFDYLLGLTNVRSLDPYMAAAGKLTHLSDISLEMLDKYNENKQFGLIPVLEVLIQNYQLLEHLENYLVSDKEFYTYADSGRPISGLTRGSYYISQFDLCDVFLVKINQELGKIKQEIANDPMYARRKYRLGP